MVKSNIYYVAYIGGKSSSMTCKWSDIVQNETPVCPIEDVYWSMKSFDGV